MGVGVEPRSPPQLRNEFSLSPMWFPYRLFWCRCYRFMAIPVEFHQFICNRCQFGIMVQKVLHFWCQLPFRLWWNHPCYPSRNRYPKTCRLFKNKNRRYGTIYLRATTRWKWSCTSRSTTRRTPSTRQWGSFFSWPKEMISSKFELGGTVNVDW